MLGPSAANSLDDSCDDAMHRGGGNVAISGWLSVSALSDLWQWLF
jgi:hypothetical protein